MQPTTVAEENGVSTVLDRATPSAAAADATAAGGFDPVAATARGVWLGRVT